MIVVLVLVVTALSLLYFTATKHVNFWANKKVTCLTPPTLWGAIRGSFYALQKDMYTFAPEEPYIGITTLSMPAICIRDPDLIELVLVKDFEHFQDRAAKVIDEKNDPLSPNLFFLDGKRSRVIRKKFSPAFTSCQLRRMHAIMKTFVNQLVTIVSSHADKPEPVDMKDLLTRCTVATMLYLSYGIEGNTMNDPDDVYMKMLENQIKGTSFIRFIQNLYNAFPILCKVLPVIKERKEINEFFLGPVLDEAHRRLQSDLSRPDFLNQILIVQKSSPLSDGALDEDPIEMPDTLMAAQAWGAFVGGTSTTSNALSFAFVEVAYNVPFQDRLRREVKAAFKRHGDFTLECLKEMSYLDQVVSEALRMYPVVRTLKRQVTKPYSMPDGRVTLPIGTRVFINVQDLHRDPRHYPKPEKFDPERFTSEAKRERHKFAHIPFGGGPRGCFGARFAVILTKLTLAALVLKFEFRVKPGFAYPPVCSRDTLVATLQHGAPVFVTTHADKVKT